MFFPSPQALLFLVLAVGATANPSNPPFAITRRSDGVSAFNPLGGTSNSPLEMVMTNAERMALGLPLNKPHIRRRARTADHPRPSAVAAAAKPGPTGTDACTTRTGVLHVTSPNTNDPTRPALDGYLSRAANVFGEYLYTTDRSQALTVTINDCHDGAPSDLRSTNGFKTFPLVGAIKGFSSDNAELRANSYNYLYIGGVTQTAPHATPQDVANSFSATTGDKEPSESAIWSLALRGSETVVEAQWVNSDGSLPTNTLVYIPSTNVFALVGDVATFEATFEDASTVVHPGIGGYGLIASILTQIALS
ncbi:hypothetical protein BC835DRAFT_1411702 [Cytidiella melzeri]|nr:hypothetical protein BC835DRAFT_1411702 [Cytidiella melzeri]